MSARDILREHYAPRTVARSEIPDEVLEVLSRHECAGTVDGEVTDAGSMALEIYQLGRDSQ